MRYLIQNFNRFWIITTCCLAISAAGRAQTDMDAIMMNKNQFCNGAMYEHSAWDHYWEGKLKRTVNDILFRTVF